MPGVPVQHAAQGIPRAPVVPTIPRATRLTQQQQVPIGEMVATLLQNLARKNPGAMAQMINEVVAPYAVPTAQPRMGRVLADEMNVRQAAAGHHQQQDAEGAVRQRRNSFSGYPMPRAQAVLAAAPLAQQAP